MNEPTEPTGGEPTTGGEANAGVSDWCSLSKYRQIVRNVPRPSELQIQAFVEYVSGAHSWYKHLPFFPPGERFFFFLDPAAGCDWVGQPNGKVLIKERTPDTPRDHYNQRITPEYRNCFGHLAYGRYSLARGKLDREGDELLPSALPLFVSPDEVQYIPLEIAMASEVRLLATLHENIFGAVLFGPTMLAAFYREVPELLTDRYWEPREGDSPILRRLREFYDPRASPHPQYPTDGEGVQVLKEERTRQRSEMAEAIRRMLALAYHDEAGDSPVGSHPGN